MVETNLGLSLRIEKRILIKTIVYESETSNKYENFMRKYISMFPYSYIVKALLSGGDKRAEDLSKPPTKKL